MISLHQISLGIGLLGVVVIVFGVTNGLWRYVRSELRSARGCDMDDERKRLRHRLGYHLLLGLEFLIAADIIGTLMQPTPNELLVLGAIIVMRSIISWSLKAELASEQQQTAK